MSSQAFPSLPASPLVDADWLKSHADDVIVLDASIDRIAAADGTSAFEPGHALFARGHIPGARLADLFSSFSDPEGPFPFTRPTASGLEHAARALGIDNTSTVVVYDSLGGAWAARVWWVLRANGFDRVRVLNGGLASWTAIGGVLELGQASPVGSGDFTAAPQPGYFVDTDAVKAQLEEHSLPLVCGVRHVQFTGEDSDDPRGGHIPGSISMPYNEMLDSAGRLDVTKVADMSLLKGLVGGPLPILYCGGGINAAGLALALAAIGRQDPVIYDGSLNEWKADPSLPLVRGKG